MGFIYHLSLLSLQDCRVYVCFDAFHRVFAVYSLLPVVVYYALRNVFSLRFGLCLSCARSYEGEQYDDGGGSSMQWIKHSYPMVDCRAHPSSRPGRRAQRGSPRDHPRKSHSQWRLLGLQYPHHLLT
jgi:hypothetical protein